MDLAIYRVANKKLVLDEMNGIIKLYPKLMEDPKTKIKRMSQELKLKIILPCVYVVIQVVILFYIRNAIFFMGLGAGIMAAIMEYLRYEEYSKELEIKKSEKTDAVLSISENRIQFINNVTNRVRTIEWEKIKQILITANCICFMPEYIETGDMNDIIISRDYEIEILEILKKVGKDKLIVFN